MKTPTLKVRAVQQLEAARAALEAIGLTIRDAADLERAAQLAEEAEYLEVETSEALVETLVDTDPDDIREDLIDTLTRAANHLTH